MFQGEAHARIFYCLSKPCAASRREFRKCSGQAYETSTYVALANCKIVCSELQNRLPILNWQYVNGIISYVICLKG